MELNPQEIAELAEFFARRFSDREAPARFAAELRLDVGTMPTWQEVIELAHARGRLRTLARAAAEKRPEDPNLRELEATLAKAPARGRGALVLAGAAAVIGLLAVARSLSAPDEAPEAPPIEAPTAPPAEAPPPVAPVAEAPEIAAPVDAAPVDAAPVDAAPADVLPPAPPEPAAPGAKDVSGRCGGAAGARVGYWYAGSKAPGEAGELITLRSGANVRTDYPRRDNRWRYSFPVVCNLEEGDRVRLSSAPIRVDGGDWWVPLHAGDLQQ